MFITVKFFKIRLSICSYIIVLRLWNNIMFEYLHEICGGIFRKKERKGDWIK